MLNKKKSGRIWIRHLISVPNPWLRFYLIKGLLVKNMVLVIDGIHSWSEKEELICLTFIVNKNLVSFTHVQLCSKLPSHINTMALSWACCWYKLVQVDFLYNKSLWSPLNYQIMHLNLELRLYKKILTCEIIF